MRKSQHDWKVLIAEQSRSGQSIDVFCRTRGLTASNFYAARQRLGQTSVHPTGLIPIQVKASRDESISIELKLSGSSVALRGSVSDLALLLRAL